MTTATYSDKIAKALLDIQAVFLKPNDPFTLSSGLKSPIYCDNRLTISYPEVRELIAEGFVELIKEQFGDVDVIAGAATGGVPHAAWVAQKLNKPMIYVRSSAKAHGKKSLVEGVLKEGQTVVIIEDLISTGGSSLKVVNGVREAGGAVKGVAAIFSYQLDKATENFAAADCKLATLSNFAALLPIAVQENFVKAEDVETLQKWRSNPEQF